METEWPKICPYCISPFNNKEDFDWFNSNDQAGMEVNRWIWAPMSQSECLDLSPSSTLHSGFLLTRLRQQMMSKVFGFLSLHPDQVLESWLWPCLTATVASIWRDELARFRISVSFLYFLCVSLCLLDKQKTFLKKWIQSNYTANILIL